jgi:predicted phosphoribosyltransferase/predicted alpha/beta-hydrolase family hydrolase
MRFRDRSQAGAALARELEELRVSDPVVAAIPRGGVTVGFEVATRLGAPLDVVVVRKLGTPGYEELGMGAVGEGGGIALNDGLIAGMGLSDGQVEAVVSRETEEVHRRVHQYRRGRPAVRLEGRTAVVVDDGLATGYTAVAAVRDVRARGANKVILAVPVASKEAAELLAKEADEVVVVHTPSFFQAVGEWYQDFHQVSDGEVVDLLGRAATTSIPLSVEAGDLRLPGELTIPDEAKGVVVFAHGSGSSRFSPRNREVAAALRAKGLATFLFDLLTDDEARDRANVFNIDLLATRLSAAVDQLARLARTDGLPIGLFGASTGAAAALVAAADLGEKVQAVVSRGGRPDLAEARLGEVRAPTLLIVGGKDTQVLELNRWAEARMHCPVELVVVAGATHLFEEPGALEEVSELASRFLLRTLSS